MGGPNAVGSEDRHYQTRVETGYPAARARVGSGGVVRATLDTSRTVWDAGARIAVDLGRSPSDCADIVDALRSMDPPVVDEHGLFIDRDQGDIEVELVLEGPCVRAARGQSVPESAEPGEASRGEGRPATGSPDPARDEDLDAALGQLPRCEAHAPDAAEEPDLDRSPDWSALDQEGRQRAMTDFARRAGVSPEEVTWNPVLGPQLETRRVSLASDRVALRDLPADVSDERLWGLIRAQGGLPGIEITDDIRSSEEYRHYETEEFMQVQLEQSVRVLPVGVPTTGRAAAAVAAAEDLGGNLASERPDGEALAATVRERADLRMTYEIARRRLRGEE